MSGVIRKEVSFIAQKDLTLSSKHSELYGSWLVKFKTPQTKDMIVLQISTFEGKLFSMNARGQRYPHFEHPGQISKYFSLIEKNNEIFFTTAQSRIQITRAQSTNILRYRTKFVCIELTNHSRTSQPPRAKCAIHAGVLD